MGRLSEQEIKEIEKYFQGDMAGRIPDSVKMLEKYNHDALKGFYLLRKATMRGPPDGVLSKKVKELIVTAVECALRTDPTGHAKWAVDNGATPAEVHDAVVIGIWLAGMPSYHKGLEAVKVAEERYKELHA